jgi:hypothetical protein
MQRGERLERGEIIEHGLVHPHGRIVFDAAVDHAVTESNQRFSSEERPSGRDDLAHGGAVVESLCRKLPLFDDPAAGVEAARVLSGPGEIACTLMPLGPSSYAR